MARNTTVVWHVTPESNIDTVEENGLQLSPCAATWLDTGDATNPERVMKGIYVTRQRSTMEAYATTCLDDLQREMGDDERLALYKAEVDVSRLTTDPESDIAPEEPDAWIHADPIDDPELVTVGVLEG
jgi:hypothetical protein